MLAITIDVVCLSFKMVQGHQIYTQYNREFALRNWQTNCQFNLAHKLKRT